MKLNFFGKKIPALFGLILIAAAAIRIIYPNLYITDGDTSGHIFASLRLFQASLFKFQPPLENFFFQIFQFRHGFTTMLFPFFFYFIFFKILGLAISEPLLVFICASWGLLSIAAVYFFVKKLFNEKCALFSALLISFLPVHIGFSRLHTGPQIISLLFFYLSLYLLLKAVEQPSRKNKIIYFLALALYIGADNAFFIGLFFNLALIFAKSENVKNFLAAAKKIYWDKFNFIFLLPIFVYAAATIVSIRLGVNSGYLLRLFSKVSAGGNGAAYKLFSFDVFIVFLEWGGATILFLLAALFFLKGKINKKSLFITLLFLAYFSLFCLSSEIQGGYSIYALIPASILISFIFCEGKKKIIIFLLALINIFYSLGVIYNLNIFFRPPEIYGSINRQFKNNDTGGKSLAYLIRENKLEVSKNPISGKEGLKKERYGIVTNDDSIGYYLAAETIEDLNKVIASGEFSKYARFLVVVLETGSEADNTLKKFAQENNLILAAEIYDFAGGNKLSSIYSNYRIGEPEKYYAGSLNKLYNKKYENIETLSRIYLGMF